MTKYRQSSKLNNVLYDIRGPILEEANRMEAMGHRILKLNIGNTAPFGFEAPDAIMMDIIRHLPVTQGVLRFAWAVLGANCHCAALPEPGHPRPGT